MPGLKKRSLLLGGHATSVALEPEFWAVLEDMSAKRKTSLAKLIAAIDGERGDHLLASSCRLTALAYSLSVPERARGRSPKEQPPSKPDVAQT
ncbi:ribbon-helix-helix domain-containing protein [Asticcacaulis benevestitus]|uniref:Ribbon-helix-helix domain-containing protein n=1 Tax=Asticcacaulis benevestitus DSM 16100 = ATCC BAA-896 TaxID=1121022 RepID=V4PF64_9CAUL|nr:ribbon-helix-helix domain-containing protein [Asticcacaulis benevestitus]ESQ92592.1 hypothetical protein ABENE_08110 [Asticcacaulis benevestitus DSM 16100 = ATCC BAA-896]